MKLLFDDLLCRQNLRIAVALVAGAPECRLLVRWQDVGAGVAQEPARQRDPVEAFDQVCARVRRRADSAGRDDVRARDDAA